MDESKKPIINEALFEAVDKKILENIQDDKLQYSITRNFTQDGYVVNMTVSVLDEEIFQA